MSERTLRRIVVALAGLCILYILVAVLGRGSGAAAADGAIESILEQMRDDTADVIRITSPQGETAELRLDQTWTVNGMPVDSAAVQRLIRALQEARVGSLVSTNPGNHPRLGVSTDSAWTLETQHGDRTTKLLIGRAARRFNTSYIRLPDDDATWELESELRAAAAKPVADWRDRVISRVDTARVNSVVITRDGQTYTLARADSAWRLGDDKADSMTVANVLGELARLEATAFAPDTATFDGTDRRTVTALAAAGDTLIHIEFAGREYIWRARRAADSTLFDVPSYRVDRIAPRREDASGAS